MNKVISSKYHTIFIGSILESPFQELLTKNYKDSKKVILVDEHTHEHCLSSLITQFSELEAAEIVVLPVGEESKNLEICAQVWEALLEYDIQRKDLIINLGGGVITDVGGFIASTYKRGIDFMNISTSLLGMVDASVGGKTGINLGELKNQVGTFSSAVLTVCDASFLTTLPAEEMLSGKAEMLKHGLISSADLWKKLIQDKVEIENSILYDTIQVKASIVDKDFKEENERKKLNFGHTVGHALESLFISRRTSVAHGICVAWGMLAESYLSTLFHSLKAEELQEIERFIRSSYPKIALQQEDIPLLLQLMKKDKKNTQATINFTLLDKIGEASINHELEERQIEKALQKLMF